MTSAIGMPNSKSVVKALPSQMMVSADGNVGIGVTNPLAKLHVNGTPRIVNANFGFITITKTMVNSSTVSFAQMLFSDYVGNLNDNVSGLVIVSLFCPTATEIGRAASYVGLLMIPRGAGVGASLTQISTSKGTGITTWVVDLSLSQHVQASSDMNKSLMVTFTFLGGGGRT
jgi:hypothetical protein